MKTGSRRQKRGIFPVGACARVTLLIVCAAAVSACTTSGAFRGVGAQPEQDPSSEIAFEPTTIETSPSALAAIEENAPVEAASGDPIAIGAEPAQTPANLTAANQQTATSNPKLYEGVSLNIVNYTEPDPFALIDEEIPPAPEMATDRQEAIQQIRDKATGPSDIPTNVFSNRRSAVPKLSTLQQQEKTAEMQAAAERNAALLGADEAKRRSADAKNMSQIANRHYREALQRIEAPESAADE